MLIEVYRTFYNLSFLHDWTSYFLLINFCQNEGKAKQAMKLKPKYIKEIVSLPGLGLSKVYAEKRFNLFIWIASIPHEN